MTPRRDTFRKDDVEQNLEVTIPAAEAVETPEAAPVRRRASRRATAAAGAAGDVAITATEASAAEASAAEASAAEVPAAEAPAAEAAEAAPKRATRTRKKAEPVAEPSESAETAESAETGADKPAAKTTAAKKTAAKAPAKTAAKTAAKSTRTTKAKSEEATATTAEPAEVAGSAEVAEAPTAAEAAPKKRATRARKTVAAEPSEATDAAETTETAESAESAPAEATAAPKRTTRARKKAEPVAADETVAGAVDATEAGTQSSTAASDPAAAEQPAEAAAKTPARSSRTKSAAAKAAEAQLEAAVDAKAAEKQDDSAAGEQTADAEASQSGRRSRRRAGSGATGSTGAAAEQSDAEQTGADEGKGRGRGSRQESAKTDGDSSRDNQKNDSNSRSSRTRQRDRKRRGGDDHEFEITEDDVLLPIAGILDVLDNYAFVRTSGYLPGVSDVYVALGQVKKYGLRRGDAIVGAIRQPRESDNNGRQKYNAIVKIDSVNGKSVDETEKRPDIAEMTPVFPQQRVRLDAGSAIGRAVDAIAPIGLGQRALLVLPAHFSGAEVVRDLAADISASTPDAHLMVVLTDAQPEVATELGRSIKGEVVAATFDRLPEDQTTIAELGIDRARRLVELGHDVIVLVDSLNRLARGYSQSQQPAVRPQLGAIDEHAIFQLKRLLAAARNVENGGSLTLLATANAAGGGETDALLLRELKVVASSILEIDPSSSVEAPVLDARESRTQNLQAMLDEKEAAAVTANRSKAAAATARSAK